jgi:hypothetical protein
MAIEIPEMTTANVPIGNDTDDIIVEGDSFERDFEYQEDDGTAVDFTGYTGTSHVRDAAGSLTATLTVATLDSTGIVTLTLATLPSAGVYDYDVEIVGGSIKKTIQRGAFTVLGGFTQ